MKPFEDGELKKEKQDIKAEILTCRRLKELKERWNSEQREGKTFPGIICTLLTTEKKLHVVQNFSHI